jgi:hypothetical protein
MVHEPPAHMEMTTRVNLKISFLIGYVNYCHNRYNTPLNLALPV